MISITKAASTMMEVVHTSLHACFLKRAMFSEYELDPL